MQFAFHSDERTLILLAAFCLLKVSIQFCLEILTKLREPYAIGGGLFQSNIGEQEVSGGIQLNLYRSKRNSKSSKVTS